MELSIFDSMFYIRQHILHIIDQYRLQLPLHHYLRNYFRKHPKLGSRDRRAIADAIYAFYRAKPFLNPGNEPWDDLRKACAMVHTDNDFLRKILQADATYHQPEKPVLQHPLPELSKGIGIEDYAAALLQQPDVFIRLLRSTKEHLQIIRQHYPDAVVIDTPFFKDCIVRLPGNCQLQHILPENDYVIQDVSSQLSLQIALTYSELMMPHSGNLKIWDVCSGAGGKTILLKNIIPDAHIVATDIRESILHNLRSRIKQYRLNNIVTLQADIAVHAEALKPYTPFDGIICDVPCSGSGTWARSPEQHCFFNINTLNNFSERQFQIACNAQQHIQSGGYLFYITCSVFKMENEDVISRLAEKTGLQILHQQTINGTKKKADSMFVAILKK